MVYAERYSTKENHDVNDGLERLSREVHSRVRDLGKLNPELTCALGALDKAAEKTHHLDLATCRSLMESDRA